MNKGLGDKPIHTVTCTSQHSYLMNQKGILCGTTVCFCTALI